MKFNPLETAKANLKKINMWHVVLFVLVVIYTMTLSPAGKNSDPDSSSASSAQTQTVSGAQGAAPTTGADAQTDTQADGQKGPTSNLAFVVLCAFSFLFGMFGLGKKKKGGQTGDKSDTNTAISKK